MQFVLRKKIEAVENYVGRQDIARNGLKSKSVMFSVFTCYLVLQVFCLIFLS